MRRGHRASSVGLGAVLHSSLWRGAGGENPGRQVEGRATHASALPHEPSPLTPLTCGEGNGTPLSRHCADPTNSPLATAIGVDIGGTNLRAARVSASGEILDRRAEPTVRERRHVLDRIVVLCSELLDPSVQGIGLGVPGRVDARARSVLSGGYLDLAGVSLVDHLEQALGRPVAIDNDGNMALLAEMMSGAAHGFGDAAMFTIGTGIGGAIATGGRILRGRATAGQLGHLAVTHPGLPCACGGRGCVETTSSGTALGRLIADAGLSSGTTVAALIAAEAAGDPRAREVLDRWIHPLRAAIDSIVAAFDPEIVLLGGGLGTAATCALARAPARSAWFRDRVAAARLGDDAGVIGAALSALLDLPAEPRAPKRATG